MAAPASITRRLLFACERGELSTEVQPGMPVVNESVLWHDLVEHDGDFSLSGELRAQGRGVWIATQPHRPAGAMSVLTIARNNAKVTKGYLDGQPAHARRLDPAPHGGDAPAEVATCAQVWHEVLGLPFWSVRDLLAEGFRQADEGWHWRPYREARRALWRCWQRLAVSRRFEHRWSSHFDVTVNLSEGWACLDSMDETVRFDGDVLADAPLEPLEVTVGDDAGRVVRIPRERHLSGHDVARFVLGHDRVREMRVDGQLQHPSAIIYRDAVVAFVEV